MSITRTLGPRRVTRKVKIGDLFVGGGGPILVQSMANVPTREVDKCVEQIGRMVRENCEVVRLAVPTRADTAALREILGQVSVPIVADVHFHYQRAIEAIEAGVSKIRLNPGNISDRRQVEEVISACRANGVAIRVGVNQGSIRPHGSDRSDEDGSKDIATLMVDKLGEYVRIFEDNDFGDLVLSAKCHDAAGCIVVNRAISEKFDYPLHLGVTHGGTVRTGAVRSAVGMGTLLAEGIGDTIRVSLTGDPLVEIAVAWEILNTLKLRDRQGPELIACPTCGRTEIDVAAMAEKVEKVLADIKSPITVAVMGCVVNGPGEAEGADVALCGGKNKAAIYRGGQKVATVAAEMAVDALLKQVKIFIDDQNTK